MRILSFRIENFRNLRLAECSSLSDFMVICGGNGCGKSALLEALMTAKEHVGAYGNFRFDPRAVSADATQATITMKLAFADNERLFVKERFSSECPETDEVVIEINKDIFKCRTNNRVSTDAYTCRLSYTLSRQTIDNLIG